VKIDPIKQRLRCMGHILNLACKAFLFVTDDENLEEDDNSILKATLKEIEEWRKKGPLGKLHNFVVFIQRSTQRINKFLALSQNRHLARDNNTRWNSWYTMLKVALLLQEAIEEYFDTWLEEEYSADRLTLEEWKTLEKVKTFLEKLKEATKALESRHSTLNDVLPCMDFILGKFEDGKAMHKSDAIMAPMFNSGWSKLDKYYQLTDESPAYIAALVLHPGMKWQYIQKKWKRSWHANAKRLVAELWEQYKPVDTPIPQPDASSTTPNEFIQWKSDLIRPTVPIDEYDRYCQADLVWECDKPLKWWLEDTQQKAYPNLSKMAIDILSIPAMSAEPERLFSSAKITITDRRNRLRVETIEALECLKSWFGIQDWELADKGVDGGGS
jgi:hypothetical protein